MTIKQELSIARRILRWFEVLPSCTIDFLIDREMCKRLRTQDRVELANIVVWKK